MPNLFDESTADALESAFEAMFDPVRYAADDSSEFVDLDAIIQGERGVDEYTESGQTRKTTRHATFVTDPESSFFADVRIVRLGTVIIDETAYTITDIENKPGSVDVTLINAGSVEWTKEDFRR